MRLRFTLSRPGGETVDLEATADSTVTIGELAAAIESRDPTGPGVSPGGRTLRIHPAAGREAAAVLPGAAPLARSGLRSGSVVSIAATGDRFQAAGADRGPAAATLHVLFGPDAGREFPLSAGTSFLGRERDCDVVLSDPLVSKRHARITVAETVEIVDTGSANGLSLDDAPVTRAVLGPTDRVVLGGTVIGVTRHRVPGSAVSADIEFNRSPRLDPTYVGRTFVAPSPPERSRRQPFPWIATLAPLLMGIVLFALTKSTLSVVFIAVSPLLMVANYAEHVWRYRRQSNRALGLFRDSLSATRTEIQTAIDEERAARLAETPSAAATGDAVSRLTDLLWARRPADDRFLTARLGVGAQPSRQRVELPARNRTQPQHWRELQRLADAVAVVDGVPVVLDLRECGSVGFAGPRAEAVSIARGVVAQLVALHSPADLNIAAVTSSVTADDWRWLKWLPHNGGPCSPIVGPQLQADPAGGAALIAELERLVAGSAPASSRVLLVVEDDAPVKRSRLVGLAERGPAAGIHLLWVAGAQQELPAACRTFVSVDPANGAVTVGSGRAAYPVSSEPLEADAALALARTMAPIVDSGAGAGVGAAAERAHDGSRIDLRELAFGAGRQWAVPAGGPSTVATER